RLARCRGPQSPPVVGAMRRSRSRPAAAARLGDLAPVHITERGPPGLHRRRTAQQRATLPFGHPTPDAVLDAVVQGIHEALQSYRTRETDLSGLPLRCP